MIKVAVENKIKLPKNLFIRDDLIYIAQKIIIPLLVKGIDAQRTITGGTFPPLEPATIAMKSGATIEKKKRTMKTMMKRGKDFGTIGRTLQGISSKTLIDTGKLRQSFDWWLKGSDSIVISLGMERKQIGEYLQIEGVGKKKKKFHFFGITDGMQVNSFNYLKKQIRKTTAKFNGQ